LLLLMPPDKFSLDLLAPLLELGIAVGSLDDLGL
jgi:hypothetical protein